MAPREARIPKCGQGAAVEADQEASHGDPRHVVGDQCVDAPLEDRLDPEQPVVESHDAQLGEELLVEVEPERGVYEL